MIKGMLHLNGNLLCVVDVETTGFIPGHHDIWQIAVLPLNADLKPAKEVMPFCMDMQVKRPENIDRKAVKGPKVNFARRQQRAIEPYTCADMFEEWFERLNLPIYKKICPLAQNWPFDRAFIIDWLGNMTFDYIFHPWYRDAMVASIFINDVVYRRGDKIERPQHNLQFLCSRLGVKNDRPHDALQDCIATAEVYRRLVMSIA